MSLFPLALRAMLAAAVFADLGGKLDASDAKGPNILFIAIDDQNDWIGCLGGHPQVKTPNLDRLARRGTLFSNAHCQAPLCNPSRASLLTGLRPSTTGVYGLAPGIREVESLKSHVTLPQTYTRAGWFTFTCGKVYHDGSEELYDLQADPKEWRNLAADAQFATVTGDLARWLPKVNQPPVPGSAHRVLTYDPASGEVVWEGQKVGQQDPIPD